MTGIRWQISKMYDYDHNPSNGQDIPIIKIVNIQGPWDLDESAELTTAFRLYDDEGYLVASGWMSEECAFQPLDDYGTPALGATELRYLVNRRWEIL